MSDFPASIPVFITLADEVDDILAEHQNTPNDEITALATLVGALGLSQSKSNNLMTWFEEQPATMFLTWVDADTVRASTGIIWVKNQPVGTLGTQRACRRNTSTTDITVSALIGGGAFANSTAYYVYADGDAVATDVTFVIGTDGSTPSGVTLYKLLGGFSTDGSGDIIETSVWSARANRLLQSKRYETGAMIDCANATPAPIDDSAPANDEGDQIMTDVFKPTLSTSRIRITVEVNGTFESTNQGLFWLLIDSDTQARKTGSMTGIGTSLHSTGRMTFEYKPGSSSLITAYVRAGQSSTGYHFTFNGLGAAAKMGGSFLSSITFEEFEF